MWNNYRPDWKPARPYTPDEKEFMDSNKREMREFFEDQAAQEEREKVAEWIGGNGKHISLHVENDKSIYWKIGGRKVGVAQVPGLRRPTQAEQAKNPELYAIVQGEQLDFSGCETGFASALGLSKERYAALRARLEK